MPTDEPQPAASTPGSLPYKIATLVELRDAEGRVLLLHRRKHPNRDLYSPIGGKLDTSIGESPTTCARREVLEETGLDLPAERFRLAAIISEAGYEGQNHWLMFYYRVRGAVTLDEREIDEGRLEWHREQEIDRLDLPETDRRVIWPLLREHGPGGFFCVHIDCTGGELRWSVEGETIG